ncbi:MAG: cation diffusion facilitator family transporter, partial [Dehalococcoidia bacterium]
MKPRRTESSAGFVIGATMDVQRQKTAVVYLSVVTNTMLVVFKIVVGLITGSVSVLSEAIHSGMDLVAALIALFAVKKSAEPADSEHPFGHIKVESISAAVEALLIFLAAAWITYEAIQRLISPTPLEMVGWGIGVMFIAAAVNLVVSEMLFKVGRKTDSAAILADGWHLRTDVYTSLGVMVGLGLIFAGGRLFPGVDVQWIDPAMAFLVALLIVKAAYVLTTNAIRDLLDTSLPASEQEWL